MIPITHFRVYQSQSSVQESNDLATFHFQNDSVLNSSLEGYEITK